MEANALEDNAAEWKAAPWLTCHDLDGTHRLYVGALEAPLVPSKYDLHAWWNLHPREFPELAMHGRVVKAPRWQQAYGRSYRFSGRVNEALPIPEFLEPLLEWSRRRVDGRLNGLLLNWYDAAFEHYIGAHRDKTGDLVPGVPIVTVSFGAERVFRVRPWRGHGVRDFPATHGTVFVLPFDTNQAWTHEVPHRARDRGRRISVTLRAFKHARGLARLRASTSV